LTNPYFYVINRIESNNIAFTKIKKEGVRMDTLWIVLIALGVTWVPVGFFSGRILVRWGAFRDLFDILSWPPKSPEERKEEDKTALLMSVALG
jgi:hypothetical protein